jgi:hypothetical protein
VLQQLEPHAQAVSAAGGPGAWEAGGGVYSAFLYLKELYSTLGRSSRADQQAPPALDFSERLEAAARLAAMLQDATARWGLGGGGKEASRIGARPGGGAAQQAVYARMSGAWAWAWMGTILLPALTCSCTLPLVSCHPASLLPPSSLLPAAVCGLPAAAELSKWVMSDGEGGGASLLPSPHQARVRPPGRLHVACMRHCLKLGLRVWSRVCSFEQQGVHLCKSAVPDRPPSCAAPLPAAGCEHAGDAA